MIAFGRIFIGITVLCLAAYFYAQARSGGPVDAAIEEAVHSVEEAADIDLDEGTLTEEDAADPPAEPSTDEEERQETPASRATDPDASISSRDEKARRLDGRWQEQ